VREVDVRTHKLLGNLVVLIWNAGFAAGESLIEKKSSTRAKQALLKNPEGKFRKMCRNAERLPERVVGLSTLS
jgi:hypothetical protein